MTRVAFIGLAALALAACGEPKQGEKKKSSGAVVAKGSGFTITADDFKAKIDEQSPFIRARYTQLERKKEFLDNLVRFEVLAKEAEKQGLAKDPDVQNTLKKIMVQKLVQKTFSDTSGANEIPEAELQKHYEEHKAEYYRPKKVRAAAVIWNAPAGSPERAKDLATAKKALAKLKVEEKKNSLAFAQIVNEFTEDAATKTLAGDLNFKSDEELTAAFSSEVAKAVFALKAGETSDIVQTDKGLFLLKVTAIQDELNRTFDQVRSQIANKLYREKKTKDFDEWLKKLKDEAKVAIDEKALDAVEISASAAPAAAPGIGMGMGMPPHGAPGGAPAAPPPAPAPPPAVAK